MGRIPVFNRAQTVNPEPQFDALVGGKGAVEQARALDDVGKQIVGVGGAVDQLQRAREKAQANDYAFDQYNQKYLDSNKYEQESKQQGIDGHAERMAKYWDKANTEAVKNAPSDLAAQSYQEQVQKFQLKSLVDASNYENFEKAKYNRQKYEIQSDKNANLLMDSGDASQYDLLANASEESMHRDLGTGYNETEIESEKIKNRQNMLLGLYNGMESREEYQKGLDLLKGNGRANTDLDPKLRGQLLKHFENGLEQKGKREASEIRMKAHDLIDSAIRSGVMDRKIYQDTVSKLQSNTSFEPYEKTKLLDNLKLSQQVAVDVSRAARAPEAEWGKFNSGKKDPRIWVEPRLRSAYEGALADIREQRKNDVVQQITDSSPYFRGLQAKAGASAKDQSEFISALDGEFDRLGIPPENRRYTSKAQSAFIAQSINQAIKVDSPRELEVQVDKIISQYGDNSNKVFEELAKDKHVDKGFFLVGQVQTEAARNAIVDNLKNGKKINESFTQQFGESRANQMKQLVGSKTSGIVSAFNGTGDSNYVLGDAFQDQVLMEAKKIKLSRSDLKDSEAVTLAHDKIVSGNYTLVSGGRSTIAKAKALNNVADEDLSTFMESSLDPRKLKEFKPEIPPTAISEEQYLNSLSRSSRWVMSPDNKSLSLVRYDQDGSIKKVSTLKNGQREPIQIPVDSIKDMSNQLKAEREKALKEMQTNSYLLDRGVR